MEEGFFLFFARPCSLPPSFPTTSLAAAATLLSHTREKKKLAHPTGTASLLPRLTASAL